MRFLRGVMRPPQAEEATDGQLLGRFVERRDEAAFAALVRSLGLLIWGVCRRLLRNRQDAEDAFQAAFLVPARKAASVMPREGVASWLHGVARRAALQARRSAGRRGEVQVNDMPDRPTPSSAPEPDLREVLDEELDLLPGRDRAVVLLCYLVGRSRREAARELGWPEGTVAGRLARARDRLRSRLLRRGLTLCGGALTAALVGQAASASVPAPVLLSTINGRPDDLGAGSRHDEHHHRGETLPDGVRAEHRVREGRGRVQRPVRFKGRPQTVQHRGRVLRPGPANGERFLRAHGSFRFRYYADWARRTPATLVVPHAGSGSGS